jgi:hypothetical protein
LQSSGGRKQHFNRCFREGISRDRDQSDQVKWEPEARTPTAVNEGVTYRKALALTFTELLYCLSHPYLFPYFPRAAKSTGPKVGLESSAPNVGRMKRF